MGTQAQVLIKETGVYLYQHWDGNYLFDTVIKSCMRGAEAGRLNNIEYLTRMIFCDMVKGSADESTGFGIGTEEYGDIEYLVTVEENRVTEIYVNDNSEREFLFKDIPKRKGAWE